uniref:ABC-type xenobiotic transporter n=1 Tax=Panstrongylus megistus TaxID=65343 RepID=A0A069DYD4_9HEMI
MDISDFTNWNWNDFCGKKSFQIWNYQYKDVDICFQYLCLQIPVLAIIATISAYYSGLLNYHVRRCKRDKWILRIRYLITLILAAIPVIRTYTEVTLYPNSLHSVDYLLSAIQCFAWLIHFSYLMSLSTHLSPSLRGPVVMGVLWSLNYILCWMNLHSNYLIIHQGPNSLLYSSRIPYIFSIMQISTQTLYLITLIPSGQHSPALRFRPIGAATQIAGEHSPLFGIFSRFREDLDPNYLGVAQDGWGCLGKLFFCWVNPLMKKGSACKLQSAEEIFDLPLSLTTSYLSMKLVAALNPFPSVGSSTPQVSLIRALHTCFWKEFYGIGLLKLLGDISGFCGPLLLHGLVSFIENKDEPVHHGYLYALGLCIASLIGAFCSSHFNYQMSVVGLKIRGALISVVYRKTLSLSTLTLSHLSTGEVVNYMSTDMDRIVNSCASFHAFWSIPFQLVVTLYLLYQQVQLSFLTGVAFTILLIPVNKYIATQIGKLSTQMMIHKDERIMLMSEILRGIRAIKFYVWEDLFISKIMGIRKKELKYLGGRKYLDAVCVYFWATTPVLISIFTFITYAYTGNKLTAPVVFTSIALLNMLIAPLNAFPWVLNGLTEAWVSIKRIEKLLQLPDLVLHDYYDQLNNEGNKGILSIRDGYFHWGETNFSLDSININISKGQFVGIIGPVGSGKSSILSAFLAELDKMSGFVSFADYEQGFAYVSQIPWLQRGTLQENILFGEPFVSQKYWAVMDACALLPDLDVLPGRDNTGIGDSGSTLSGGQKARIALARAVYQDKSIYLLDDILSAVDPHVARHILSHCICGLLKTKTRILCTHQTKYLVNADHVIVLNSGGIVRQGPPAEVLPDYVEHVTNMELETDGPFDTVKESKMVRTVSKDSILNEEERATGSLEFEVYGTYFLAIGICLWPIILASMILMQGSRNAVDWWLSYWVTNFNSSTGNHSHEEFLIEVDSNNETKYFIIIYAIIAGFNTIFTLLRAFLFAYGGLTAAKKMHKKLLNKIMTAKMIFFDTCSVGRILNRFSSDMYTVDDSLPFILNILLAQFFGLVGTIAMTVYGLPWICVVLTPLVPLYHNLQQHYRLTSRELKRLMSVTLSPLYGHFSETLQGLATIRAFGATSRFRRDNAYWLEANQKAQLSSSAAAQWLSLRLQLIGVAMITGVGMLAMIQHNLDFAQPGLIGLAISYALTLTGSLGGVVNAFVETEREMVSVERVRQYLKEKHDGLEGEQCISFVNPPFSWPSRGVVSFSNVFFRYRDHLPYSLRDVSFSTRPSERVAIVGRTGAGKSSIISALFRLAEIGEGTVTIDSVNTKLIALPDLRSRLSIIPQDPFIFEGTVKCNLDPHGKLTDGELWSALSKTQLAHTIRTLGGLETILKKGSLSVGQSQLLALTRAILQNNKVVCIDEATANVDDETDRLIQQTIRASFRQSTIITIAHRVRTIIDYDRVLVMGEGRVLEFDTPQNLLRNSSSYFYQLANESYQ